MADLPPVGRLVVVADESYHGGVVCILDCLDRRVTTGAVVVVSDEPYRGGVICILDGLNRRVTRGAVVGVQGEEKGGQHTTLGGAGVNCAGLRQMRAQPDILSPVDEKICNP